MLSHSLELISSLRRFILSSTSDFCIQNATIPVLVIPPTAQHFTAPKPLRYLVAYDGSDGSKGALDQTLFLSSADSTILVLSLIESFTMFDSSGPSPSSLFFPSLTEY
jgi:hypothetical protein